MVLHGKVRNLFLIWVLIHVLIYRASVMYDRPPAMFKEASLPEKHRLFTKLSQEYQLFKATK